MSQAKYILLDDGMDSVIIFPPWLIHSDIAERLGEKVLSAGFVDIVDDTVYVSGRSISLGVTSHEPDARIIRKQLRIPLKGG